MANSSGLFFSIIVSAYNVEKLIEKTIASVLGQSYPNFELIIVNDGSTDDTGTVIQQFLYDDRVNVINKENHGLSSTRNIGLSVARGDIVIFLDGDDFVDYALLSICAKEFLASESDMVFFGYDSVKENGTRIKKGIQKRYHYCQRSNKDVLQMLCKNEINNYSWSFATRKVVLDQVPKPIFPEKVYFEDVGSTYKIVLAAGQISFVADQLYHYVQRNGSITKTPSVKQFTDLSKIKTQIDADLNGIVSKSDLRVWSFFVDIMKYQILSYSPIKNNERLKEQRMIVLNESPSNILGRTVKLKSLLISCGLYRWVYPIAARFRWL